MIALWPFTSSTDRLPGETDVHLCPLDEDWQAHL
jgi:hypothetical protein